MENYKTPRLQDYEGDLSKRWYVQYAYRDPDTLKFIAFREWVSATHKSKTARYAAAKELRDKLHTKLIQGYNPFTNKEARLPVHVAISKVVDLKAKVLRKRTWHSYNSVGTSFCKWLGKNGFGSVMPHQITRHIAQGYFDSCLEEKNFTVRTYNNHLRTLRTLFNSLVERDQADFNIFNKVPLLAQGEPDLVAYSRDELVRIKAHLEENFPHLWLCALFVHYSFIRPQELVRLQVRDLDFENKTICVPASKSKNKKHATVLMPDPLHSKLVSMHYDKMDKELFVISKGRHLIPGYKEISPNRIFNAWQQLVIKGLGIDKGIYLLKHTGAGQLFDDKADPRSIQMQLRHGSLDQTLEYLKKYSRVPNEALRAAFREI